MDILLKGNNAAAAQPNPPSSKESRVPAQQAVQPVSSGNVKPAEAAKERLSETQRNDAVKQFKKNIESLASTNLKFSIDKDTERTVIKVVDKQTGDTIRQIPSEEILALDKAISRNQGLLLHDKA